MEITTLINTLGFPIACVIACGGFINKMWTEQRENNDKIMQALFAAQEVNAGFVKVLESYEKDIQDIKCNIKDIKDTVIK